MGLFEPIQPATDLSRPLADRMRPRTLEEFVGQEHILAPGKALRLQIERDDPGSIIFWGPPGVGKTTLAKIIARITKASFIEFSAVLAGIKEIKQVMADAEKARQYGSRTIVFVDEIHRFNKAQQDAFLPHVEKGNIRLIGATTENPSFEIISALLSRCRVYTLKPLSEEQIVLLLKRALTDAERGLGKINLTAGDTVLDKIAAYASGDARTAYNALEVAAQIAGKGKLSPPCHLCIKIEVYLGAQGRDLPAGGGMPAPSLLPPCQRRETLPNYLIDKGCCKAASILSLTAGTLGTLYSTVTLLARLRGWSTSVPLRTATW